ncbi:h domain protein [Rhodococcus sp. PAMC28707]|uniref:h domain protein n=1 Tax=unclassified Rhodococcus (in: high G+C Gram-positive bacteria) TaxID=192944 RepID=UPI00109DAC91|nr:MULTISPECIES: h domain protein [unclassified Rhodococcus (in: high G+C Gram-positive bacteria)]QCB50007.1 h domain protein [Rhodococcus sp. PAMC28705]QCB58298.1 h domain protein [Rhodococcus sp. PAMC28707]
MKSGILLRSLAVVIVLALAAGVGVLFYQYRQNEQTEQARTDALTAASAQATSMLAYDFANVDQQLGSAADGLTGDFKDEYTKLVTEVIAPSAKEKSLTVQVTVQGTAVVSADPDEATIMLFLNQITTSTDAPDAASSGSRVRMKMEKVDGRWLASELTPI